MRSPWPLKPTLVLATFGVMITLPQYIQQWYNWRIYEWAAAPAVFDFQPRNHSTNPLQDEADRLGGISLLCRGAESRQQGKNREKGSHAQLYNFPHLREISWPRKRRAKS